jgi:hypothetical protein
MEIIEVENPITKEITEFVIIDRGNNEFTSMPKAVWDAQEAAKQTGTIS